MKSPCFLDPMSPDWRSRSAIAALERRREVRVIVCVVMLNTSLLAGLMAAIVEGWLYQFLVSMCVTSLVSAAWQLVCIGRCNFRIANLKEDFR